MADLTASLAQRLATSATGYAAVTDGVLDLRTVAPDQNSTAYLAIGLAGMRILSNCRDPGCDCRVRLMERLLPESKIVTVSVEVTNDSL